MAIQQANGDNLLIGAGTCWFDRFDVNGNPTGIRFLGEAKKLDGTSTATNKEVYTSTRANRQKIANINTQQKHMWAIELMEMTRDNAALAFLGDASKVIGSQTTVVNETIAGGVGQAPPAIGRSYLLKNGFISGLALAAVAIDGTTTTPLVQGTDYQIEDATVGLITLLSATAVAANTVKATTYTSGASTIAKVTGGTSLNIKGMLLFIADPTAGPAMNLQAWKVEVSPSGAFALISEDFASFTLDVEVLDDSLHHPDSPLYTITYPKG